MLKKIRKEVHADQARINEIEARIAENREDIAKWRKLDRHITAMERAAILKPWIVLTEADWAAAHANLGGDVPFRAVTLAILKRETGIPQRNVFGCDHGPQGGKLPFCGDECTKARVDELVAALHRDPWSYMNGVGWTQLTWYEKVLRADKLDGGASLPRNQLRVGMEDLALLIKTYGIADGVRRYNGAGPAADEYSHDVVTNLIPWARRILSN